MSELDNLRQENERLKDALRKAILNTNRVVRRCVEVDPAGNTYEVDWLQYTKEWADLCGLDLDQHAVEFYC